MITAKLFSACLFVCSVKIIQLSSFYVFCRNSKPQSFADCVGDELPFGWEKVFGKDNRPYYINHNTRKYNISTTTATTTFGISWPKLLF